MINNLWDDKVMRAMFAFALGVAFVVINCAGETTNTFLLVLGVIWCLVALYWTVKQVKADWNA